MTNFSPREPMPDSGQDPIDPGVLRIAQRLKQTLQRDTLVQRTVDRLRTLLKVDRVVLYHFYSQWQGQVTFESIEFPGLSIFGSTGADDCFNEDYAELYLQGRILAIANIESEPIHPCHRDFLRSLDVRANLVAPILTQKGLWGLLVAHHCQKVRTWNEADIAAIRQSATVLASSPAIQTS